MTLREEVTVLNESGRVIPQEEVDAVNNIFDNLIKYFNSIGEAAAANVFRNMKNRPAGVRIRYMKKMAEMVKQYKDF